MIPAFSFKLGHPILQNLATIGKFDGKHASLAFATTPDSILIHSPHGRSEHGAPDIRPLSVNRKITALGSGPLDPKESKNKRSVLLVGTGTNLLAYDVEDNSDLFYKEVPDGVNSVAVGTVPSSKGPIAVVGGNCSIQGFDATGSETFWTVTGDNVTSLAFRDPKGDGNMEMLAGSEDYAIRVFKDVEVQYEINEADTVTGLVPMQGGHFGFCLDNGTIGVYNDQTRVWHAKSKHKVNAVAAYDLDQDGVPELVSGWASGKLEVRTMRTGELVYKDRFASSIAAVTVADYRGHGRDEIVACSVDGEVRGYVPRAEDDAGVGIDLSAHESTLKQLSEKKQELLKELKTYEDHLKNAKAGKAAPGGVPAGTKITYALKPSRAGSGLVLTLQTNNEAVIKMAMVFSDVLFEEESKVYHPGKPSTSLSLLLKTDKNVATEVMVKVVVGLKTTTQDHVFEINCPIPRFAAFVYCRPRDISDAIQPKSSVTFNTTERVNRVVLWMQQSFNIDEKQPINGLGLTSTSDTMHAGFISVRDGKALIFRMAPDHGGSQQVMTIRCDDMDLVGDIVQDLARYLKIDTLESQAEFPDQMEAFEGVLAKVEEHNAIRLRLSAEMADSTQVIKMLLIRAEDARMLDDMPLTTKLYSRLFEMNRELIGEYNKRANNHAELLKALKEVSQMIQRASQLRVGAAKTAVVAACRKAIKTNNTQALFKLIRFGHAGEKL